MSRTFCSESLLECLLAVHQDSTSHARRREMGLHRGMHLVCRSKTSKLPAAFRTESGAGPVVMPAFPVRTDHSDAARSSVFESPAQVVAKRAGHPVDQFTVEQQLGDEEMVADLDPMPVSLGRPYVENHAAPFLSRLPRTWDTREPHLL